GGDGRWRLPALPVDGRPRAAGGRAALGLRGRDPSPPPPVPDPRLGAFVVRRPELQPALPVPVGDPDPPGGHDGGGAVLLAGWAGRGTARAGACLDIGGGHGDPRQVGRGCGG